MLEPLLGKKIGECSSKSVPCGQGTPELLNSNTTEETSDSCSVSYKILVMKKWIATEMMILIMRWKIVFMNLTAEQ